MTMPPSPSPIDTTMQKLLVVEGEDDRRFFGAFLKHLQITDMRVQRYGGTPNFRNFLTQLVASAQFNDIDVLGIVRDSDRSRQSAFASIISSLQHVGLPVPPEPVYPVTENGLTISVLIIPPDSHDGALEDLCLSALGDNDRTLVCVDQYLDCAANSGTVLPKRSKSRLHAYLAAGNEPGRRLGEAADAGIWDWSSPEFAQVADFLRSL